MLRNSTCALFLSSLDVQAVFNFRPSVLQHLRCNSFNLSNNSELQFVERVHRGLVKNVLNVSSRKKSSGVISGENGGHGISPSRPTQRPGKCMSRNSRPIRAQCRGAPSCWNATSDRGGYTVESHYQTAQ
jgi:hypothetical protein